MQPKIHSIHSVIQEDVQTYREHLRLFAYATNIDSALKQSWSHRSSETRDITTQLQIYFYQSTKLYFQSPTPRSSRISARLFLFWINHLILYISTTFWLLETFLNLRLRLCDQNRDTNMAVAKYCKVVKIIFSTTRLRTTLQNYDLDKHFYIILYNLPV